MAQPSLSTALCLLAALVLAPAAGAVTIQDAVFADADWAALELVDTSTNDSFAITAEQSPTGGNPGAYRRVVQSVNEAGPVGINIVSGHVFQPVSYDPGAEGAIDTVRITLDGIGVSGPAGAMAYGGLIEQSGMFFISFFGQTLNGSGFQPFGGTPQPATAFSKVVGGIGTDPDAHPDFSASADAMRFGFLVSNGTFGTPSINEGGVDNWRVEIARLPEPSVVTLLGAAALAGGLGTARPRRG